MSTQRYISFSSSFVLLALACVNSPEDVPAAKRFSRNSAWKIDTLSRQESVAMRIWASSSSDAYAVGYGGDVWSAIWHFDGTKWSVSPFQLPRDQAGDPDPESIFGFSSTDIWIAGTHWKSNPSPPPNFTRSALLAHFDGKSWTKTQINAGPLYSIWGLSPNNIWVGGEIGEMLHFDGSTWSRDSLGPFSTPSDFWYFLHIVGSEGVSPYATIYSTNGNTGFHGTYLLQRQGSVWRVLDSLTSRANDIYHLWLSPSNTLYGAGGRVCRWTGSSWEPLRPQTFHLNVFGTTDDNLLAIGYSPYLSHYNGNDWFELPGLLQASNAFIYDGWTDGSSVLLCAHDGGKSLILRNY